jgi:CubicO group peptidase (beta-lactamase class C family)
MKSHAIHDLMHKGLRENVLSRRGAFGGQRRYPVFFEAYGKANLFSGHPMTRETVFDLASLTKPLATTLAVARSG